LIFYPRSTLLQNSDIWVKYYNLVTQVSRTNHVCAEYYGNHNYKDWFYDRLNNRCIQNAYGFHN